MAPAAKPRSTYCRPAPSSRSRCSTAWTPPLGGQAQSDPLSVDLEAIKPANLPNGKSLDVRGCRIVSSAWGDLSAERMMGRTQTLSCIIAGRPIEIDIKGKLIGEDGKEGVRGRLVTKQGQVLANAILAGSLGGIGQAFQQSATVTSFGGGGVAQTIDGGQVGRAAIGGGVGTAGQMLAQYYLKAADKLFPRNRNGRDPHDRSLDHQGRVCRCCHGRAFRGAFNVGPFPQSQSENPR
ncbi:TraB/VirB10 family protein [Burkholderia cenocepacia]|uniref:TraB/VirB10 family protein n=1 Tax=Burkholderia cenocepacia TaxID=95486 RepID=UPI0020124337|nr:TraB/VirB10 family protein [Burkholderia cenocepacia]